MTNSRLSRLRVWPLRWVCVGIMVTAWSCSTPHASDSLGSQPNAPVQVIHTFITPATVPDSSLGPTPLDLNALAVGDSACVGALVVTKEHHLWFSPKYVYPTPCGQTTGEVMKTTDGWRFFLKGSHVLRPDNNSDQEIGGYGWIMMTEIVP